MTARDGKDCGRERGSSTMGETYACEESPDVCREQDDAGNDEERSLAPDVGAGRGEEGREADPKGQEPDDQARR